MRVLAVLLVILAILIAVVPHFNNCRYDGKLLALANGKQVPMKCYWTAQSEIAMAVPLLAVGMLLPISKRRETRRALAALGGILGILVVLLPTVLIGMCTMDTASCNLVSRPALTLMGALALAVSLVSLVVSQAKPGKEW